MNKKMLSVVSVVALLFVAGAGYYVYLANDGPEEAAQVTETEPRSAQPTPAEESTDKSNQATATSTSGEYKAYSSEQEVTTTKGTKILFFHAPWCPQCRQLDSDLQSTDLPDNTTIFKVDYDSNQDLRAKYGVTLQTTLVAVDSDGELIKKYVAYDEPTYETVNREFISTL